MRLPDSNVAAGGRIARRVADGLKHVLKVRSLIDMGFLRGVWRLLCNMFSLCVHMRLWRGAVARAMALLALVIVTSLMACGQYVLPAERTVSDTQPPSSDVPTATQVAWPMATPLPTPEATATLLETRGFLPTATPLPPGYTGATVIAAQGQSGAIAVARCSRPAGTSLPDLLAEIDRLEWVSDGATSSEDESVARTEDSTIEALKLLAAQCPQVFRSIIKRDWMQTEVGNATWARYIAAIYILQIARVDEEAALAVLELPFLDRLEHLDTFAMEFWRDLFGHAPDEGRRLISGPDVRNTDSAALPTDFYLLYLESQGPAVSEGLYLLQWVHDGVDPFWDEFDASQPPGNYRESEALGAFTSLYMKSPGAFLSMVRRPWLQESINGENFTALLNVLDFAYDSPDATAQIAAMDFLDSFEEDDLIVIQELLSLKWDDRELYREILSDPTLLEDFFAAPR